MRWRGRKGSENVEDRRGQGGFRFPFPFPGSGRGGRGGRMGIPLPRGRGARRGGGIGIVGLLVILGLMFFLGIDPRVLLQGGLPRGGQQGPGGFPKIEMPKMPRFDGPLERRSGVPGTRIPQGTSSSDDDLKKFVSVVLKDTEDVWNAMFQKMGRPYREPKLVLFSNYVQSACGTGMSAMGPFYCPLDKKVYVDLTFYRELKNRFRAPGDFAQAYVIAHEVGHHVQTLLGIAEKVQQAKARMSKRDANRIQVMMELQADCLAGVWTHHAQRNKQILEPGDIDEALNAASAIGDDRIQKQTQGYVVPDSFTHGSSKQRVRWFRRGYDSGSMNVCDTFNSSEL